MITTIAVETSKLPAHIAQFLSPAKRVTVYLCDYTYIGSQCWSGGSRDQYFAALLTGDGGVKPVVDTRAWPQNMGELGRYDIVPGGVIIRKSVFCGRDVSPTIYARASDLDTSRLVAPTVNLSEQQQHVLKAISEYNSAGRARFRKDFNVSKDVWDATVKELAERGLVTTRGSITVAGSNAARSKRAEVTPS
jgi:hypothetical protein